MFKRHGIIGGPKQRPVRPKLKQPVKIKPKLVDSTESIDEVSVVIVSNKEEDTSKELFDTKYEQEIQVVKDILQNKNNSETDYDSIEDDGPISIEDRIYITTKEPTSKLCESISRVLYDEEISKDTSIVKVPEPTEKIVVKKKRRKKKAKK